MKGVAATLAIPYLNTSANALPPHLPAHVANPAVSEAGRAVAVLYNSGPSTFGAESLYSGGGREGPPGADALLLVRVARSSGSLRNG